MKKHSADGKVEFNPDFHSYSIGEKKLKSVTSFLSGFLILKVWNIKYTISPYKIG